MIEFKEITELRKQFIKTYWSASKVAGDLFDIIDKLIEFRLHDQEGLHRCAHNKDRHIGRLAIHACLEMCQCGHACWQHFEIPYCHCNHCKCKEFTANTKKDAKVPKPCKTCDGDGKANGGYWGDTTCFDCNGTGVQK